MRYRRRARRPSYGRRRGYPVSRRRRSYARVRPLRIGYRM